MGILQIMVLVGLLTFICYNFSVLFLTKGKAPVSMSETSYILRNMDIDNKLYRYSFSALCLFIVGTFLPCWIHESANHYRYLVYLSCLGVLLAGSTPFFHDKWEKYIHYGAAVLTAVSYIFWFILSGCYDWLFFTLCAIMTTIMVVWSTRVWLYLVEIYGIIGLAVYLLTH